MLVEGVAEPTDVLGSHCWIGRRRAWR